MSMQYRRLGRSGLHVSALSYGSWITFGSQLAGEAARACMHLAYDRGVNFFDNAEVYAGGDAERIMGQALAASGWARDTFVVSSKVFWGGDRPTQRGLSRKHIVEGCHQALRRLQLDHLDLYFCHRPDPTSPIEEVVLAMHTLVMQGKVLYWGTSEWSATAIAQAYEVAHANGWTPPSMEQPEYNLFARARVESEYLPLFRDYGLGTTIWSPLASGVLTGKYRGGVPPSSRLSLPGNEGMRARLEGPEGAAKVAKASELARLAGELGVSPAALAIAWCLRNPNVSTAILGASNVSQLEDNLGAIAALDQLTPDVQKQIESIADNAPAAARDFLRR